jgi:hypothetical protein
MNHILFNDATPDPGKAPQPALPDRGALSDADHAQGGTLGVYASGMGNPQFHARRMQDGPEFQCDRCGGPVVRMPGRVGTDHLPYVMYCNACDLTSGGWLTKEEREQFLQSMTVG